MAEFVNFYKILDVQQQATEIQINEAIITQRRTWVKRQQAPNKDRQREAEDRVRQIDQAQKTLLNATSRRHYDQELASYRPPTPQAGPSLEGSQDWLQRATDFLVQGDPSSAAYAAKQATEQNGANHAAWALRANANTLLHNDQDAMFEFHEAIRIKPDEPDYHFDLGAFYEQRSNWTSALSSYQAASNLRPTVPMYQVAIASVYLNNDRPSLALPIMERVHNEHPDVEDFNVYYAWALNDSLIDCWTLLKDGTRIITKPEQITKTREMVGKAKALKFDEPGLRGNLEKNLKLANDAEKIKIRIPLLKGATKVGMEGLEAGIGMGCFALVVAWGFVFFLFIGIPLIMFNANPGLGILGFGAMGFILYKTARVPQWKLQDKDSKSMQVRT